MFATRRFVVIGMMAAWFCLVPAAMVRAQDKVTVVKEVCYGDAKEGVHHQLDLYLPAGKDFPVVMFAHGGAWMMGDKKEYEFIGQFLAKNGIGVVIANYRLSPAIQHPGHVQDMAKAVAWTHANIGKHGGNREKLYISGYSAGGHLASLLGTDESYLKAEGLSFKSIRGVISISGVYAADDLPALGFIFPARNRGECFPIHHAKAGRPNFLLFHAETEIVGLDKQAVRFQTEFKKAGGSVQLHEIKGTDHFSIATEKVVREQHGRRILDFVKGTPLVAMAK